jgi:hypothetical protein
MVDPILKVYAISNGYLLEITEQQDLARQTPTIVDLVYCKDAPSIAEEIVAAAARHKLGLHSRPLQQEMFTASEMGAQRATTIDKEILK